MAKTVGSFNELVAFAKSFGIVEESAIPLAESFMDSSNIEFDADGNFKPIEVDFQKNENKLVKA